MITGIYSKAENKIKNKSNEFKHMDIVKSSKRCIDVVGTVSQQPNANSNDYNSNVLLNSFGCLMTPRSISQLQQSMNTPCGAPPPARYSFDELVECRSSKCESSVSIVLDSSDLQFQLQLTETERSQSSSSDYDKDAAAPSWITSPCVWMCISLGF
jgi:hypothetical protein